MATLSVDALRTQIQSRKLARVYLFHGDDVRLIEQMVDAIEATVDPADRPFSVERMYVGEEGASPINIAAAANVFPMLGERRIVIVMRAEKLLKPKRAGKGTEDTEAAEVAEDDADAGAMDPVPLEAYLDNPSPSTVMVIVAAAIDRSRRLTKRVLDKAVCVEFEGIASENASERREVHREAVAEVQQQLAEAGRTVDAAAAGMIVERAGGDISKLRDDVERLALFTEGRKAVTKADVEEVVATETELDDWAVVNAIADGDAARALRETGLRFERGDSPHQMVGQLRWWVSARLSAAAPDRVKPALEALLRTDLALKSSGGEDRSLVERLVLDLVGKPVAQQSWGRR